MEVRSNHRRRGRRLHGINFLKILSGAQSLSSHIAKVIFSILFDLILALGGIREKNDMYQGQGRNRTHAMQ